MTVQTASRFLDLRALAALERMRFATRQRIEGSYSGRHRSRRLGGAGEFADFREYSPGEDLRHLDWKILARTQRAFTRIYQDETNLVCTLVVDASGSMRFGKNPSKLEYVQFLATALTHVICRQQDQVGFAVVARGLQESLPPGSTAGHAERMYEAIAAISTQPATDLAGGLRDLFLRQMRRGVLMILSDWLVDDPESVFTMVQMFRHRLWEVIVLHIVHPDEERLPVGAAYRFEGLENEGRVDCTPAEIRELYEGRFEAHAALIRSSALAAGCDYLRVSTATPYLQTIGEFLVERTG